MQGNIADVANLFFVVWLQFNAGDLASQHTVPQRSMRSDVKKRRVQFLGRDLAPFAMPYFAFIKSSDSEIKEVFDGEYRI